MCSGPGGRVLEQLQQRGHLPVERAPEQPQGEAQGLSDTLPAQGGAQGAGPNHTALWVLVLETAWKQRRGNKEHLITLHICTGLTMERLLMFTCM